MTLKEFSKEYLLPVDAAFDGELPHWRKVFPSNLRYENEIVEPGFYAKNWFGTETGYVKPVYKEILVEQWERIHRGEIIDREWRRISRY